MTKDTHISNDTEGQSSGKQPEPSLASSKMEQTFVAGGSSYRETKKAPIESEDSSKSSFQEDLAPHPSNDKNKDATAVVEPESPLTGDLQSAERLAGFTDGVVAIAMTLLTLPLVDSTLDFRNNEEDNGNPGDDKFRDFYNDNKDILEAFVVSFFVIAFLWSQHEKLFRHVRQTTGALRRFNFLWLLFLVVIPLTMNLVTVIDSADVYILYSANILLARGVSLIMLILVQRDDRLLTASQRTTQHREATRTKMQIDTIVDLTVLVAVFMIVVSTNIIWFWLLVLLIPVIDTVLVWRWPEMGCE